MEEQVRKPHRILMNFTCNHECKGTCDSKEMKPWIFQLELYQCKDAPITDEIIDKNFRLMKGLAENEFREYFEKTKATG